MNHGKISKRIAKGLIELRKRIDDSNIPSSKLDETINLATWNIRDFGKTGREEASVHYIAEIMGQFDLVAVAEVRDDISDLKRVLDILGPFWHVVFSDFITDARGNRERFAYVYDKRAVAFTGMASEADEPRTLDRRSGELTPRITWYRKPYMSSFRAGSFDFIIIGAHIRWGDDHESRIEPLKMLAEWVEDRRIEKHVIDKDIILVGDFNIPKIDDDLYKAINSRGLEIPDSIRGLHGSNLKQNARYDQILHYPAETGNFTNHGGVLDFYCGSFRKLFPWSNKTEDRLTWEISDHLPLWVQLDVDIEGERLDQIIRQKD